MKRWGKKYFYLEKTKEQQKRCFYSVERNDLHYIFRLKSYPAISPDELLGIIAEKFILAVPSAGQQQVGNKRVIFAKPKSQICSIYVEDSTVIISTFKEFRMRLVEIFLWELVFPELFKILFNLKNKPV
jgi:hypothetical protein